jgi:hypothetical protein
MTEDRDLEDSGGQPGEGEAEGDSATEYRRLLSYRGALLLLAALAVMGAYTLTGKMRIFVLILDAGLALKVVLRHFREKLDDSEQ